MNKIHEERNLFKGLFLHHIREVDVVSLWVTRHLSSRKDIQHTKSALKPSEWQTFAKSLLYVGCDVRVQSVYMAAIDSPATSRPAGSIIQ